MAQGSSADPVFFYSSEIDYCSARGFEFQAPNNTQSDDLCAYIPKGPPRGVWACPAPDDVCWTVEKPCLGSDAKTPSHVQIACIVGDVTWCCNGDWEICTGKAGETGVCWAKTFENPLEGVNKHAASSLGASARAAKNTGALNSQLSAISRQIPTTDISPTAVPTSSLFASAGSQSNSDVGAPPTSSTTSSSADSSHSLSGGAIVGIVIGCISGLLLVFAAGCLILRRRRASDRPSKQLLEMSSDSEIKEIPSAEATPSSYFSFARAPPDGQLHPVESGLPPTPSIRYG